MKVTTMKQPIFNMGYTIKRTEEGEAIAAMPIRLVVGIPTINRKDLLIKTLDDLSKNMPDLDYLMIVDNGNQGIRIPDVFSDKSILRVNEVNVGVAGSWNYLARRGFETHEATHVMLIEDDVVFGHSRNDVEQAIQKSPNTAIGCPSFATLILSKVCYNDVGPFDEKFFPAYYEDNDYAYRMKLKGYHFIHQYNLRPIVELKSQSIAKNSNLNKNFVNNHARYLNKWGGEPQRETYTTPFNGGTDA